MAHPARAIDRFTEHSIRVHEHKVFMALSRLETECGKLRELVAPFSKDALDDYDDIGIELLHKWLKGIRSALNY